MKTANIFSYIFRRGINSCPRTFCHINFIFTKEFKRNFCSLNQSKTSWIKVPNKFTCSKASFSRHPRSWTKFHKKSYVLESDHAIPKYQIPSDIIKPEYAETGVTSKGSSHIHIFDEIGIKHMQESCSLAKSVLNELSRHVEVGISTSELDSVAYQMCIKHGAYPSPLNYRGFPKCICTSVNNVACHGIPDGRKLKNGDIISIDVSVYYNGYHGDCASTFHVGDVDPKGQVLIDVSSLCLEKAINVCHEDQNFCAIGNTISKIAKSHGFSVVPAFCGHGIGTSFHCEPNILHYENNDVRKMSKGMIFTIEPVICEGEPDIVILEDGWTAVTEDGSRSAQFEHTILITEDGAKILTVPDAYKP